MITSILILAGAGYLIGRVILFLSREPKPVAPVAKPRPVTDWAKYYGRK